MSIIWVSLLHNLLHSDPVGATVSGLESGVFFLPDVFGVHQKGVTPMPFTSILVFPDGSIWRNLVIWVVGYHYKLPIRQAVADHRWVIVINLSVNTLIVSDKRVVFQILPIPL